MASRRICFALATLLLLLLAAGCAAEDAVQAAGVQYGATVMQCLKKAGLTKYIKLVNAAGLTDYFSTTYQVNTIFAATNDAMSKFYAALKLTESQALANKQLVKQVLQYNTLPYVRRLAYWPNYMNGFVREKTLVPGLFLRLYKTQAGRAAIGGFANNATVLNKPNSFDLVCARSIMQITDNVLLPIQVA